MSIGKNILTYHNKAYLEVHNNGSHVGVVITLLPDSKFSLGIAYVLTN
jgi:hypothetical protein